MMEAEEKKVSRVFHDNGNIVARWESCGSKILAVVFDPMKTVGIDQPAFSEMFLRNHGVDVLAIQRRGETWYQDLSRRTFDNILKPLRKRYNRIVFYGTSLGAYAALYFARDEHVLAFSPRIPAHPDYRKFAKKADLNNAPFVHDPLGYTPNAVIIYDPMNGWDRQFVDNEVRAPKSALFPVPFGGHSVITCLNDAKILQGVALDYIKAGKKPSIKALREARRLSPKAHLALADTCAARKHETWAALAVAIGLDNWPSDKELLSRVSKFGIVFSDDAPPMVEEYLRGAG